MAVYAIGDLQGCYDEFQRLLEKLNFDPTTDELWLTGDLVNRGPKSLEVLRFVRNLGNSVKTVLGNHDLNLLAMAYTPREPRRKDTLDAVLHAPDCDELLEWLRHLPLMHRCETLGWTMVHAGISPQWSMKKAAKRAREVEHQLQSEAFVSLLNGMYGNTPDRWSKRLEGIARHRYIINAFTRMRYCRDDKSLDMEFNRSPEEAPAELVPWYAHPKRKTRGERILFGHWSTLGVRSYKGALSLDTGCVWGGSMTAVELTADSKKPGITIQLPCEGALKPGS